MPPRPLRPKDEPGASEDRDSKGGKGGKRRAVSSACIPCRKRKSKCDGALPSCSTCTAVYRTECAYDEDSDHRRKGALKRDIQSLQQQNDALDVIVASLRSLPESEAIALLYSLRNDTNLETLASNLRSNVSLPQNFAPQTLEADFSQQISQTPSSASTKFRDDSSGVSREGSSDNSQSASGTATPTDAPAIWFRTPHDAEFVEHLLSLYFCWIHPFYQFLSRDRFIHDMGSGNTEFCSALLVNALLSFACHYSDRPMARTDPNNPSTAGDHFFAEAKRLLDSKDSPCLTTVQALGIMSIRETSQGRDSNGYQLAGRCVRMALELGLHLSMIGSGLRSAEFEVRRVAFWGSFNLETICSVGFGRLSQLPREAADIQRPAIHERSESQIWRPYEDSNISISSPVERQSPTMLFMEQLSRLSELASEMVNTFYAPKERFTSRGLATAYAQYQEWYQSLPDVFRLENTTLPHVLVLHMYYYACVLHLFRPYIKLDLHHANLYPRDTCTACANEISGIMNALRSMYGLRRVCLAVTSLLLSATTIHLLNLPSEPAASHLSQGLRDLQAMSINHPFAARCIDIIQTLSLRWNIVLPEDAALSSATGKAGLQRWPSPSSSTFWAAGGPRIESSRAMSSSNISGHHGSLAPSQAQVQQHSPVTPIFSNTAGSLDTNQAQSAFWTPFPGQTMPMPSQHMMPSTTMDYSMGNPPGQGVMFSSSTSDLASQMHEDWPWQ